MPITKGSSAKVTVFAFSTVNGQPETGDAANITAEVSLDGGASTATDDTNPTELDATDHPGVYVFDMTASEMDADLVVISAVSSTAGVSIEPVSIYTLDVASIVDSIWDEAISGHQSIGSVGLTLGNRSSHSPADVWAVGTRELTASLDPTASAIATAVWSESTRTLTSSLDPTASDIADAVWDEQLSGHTASGSAGEAAGRLDVAVSSRTTAGEVWSNVSRTLTSSLDPDAASIADAVLDELVADHTTAGTAGEALGRLDAAVSSRSSHAAADVWSATPRTLTSSLDPDAAAIADAVLDEALSGHTNAGSLGEAAARLDADVSTRSSHSASDVWAVGTRTLTSSLDPTADQVADAVLSRSVSNVEDTAGTHTIAELILAATESSISGTTWTIRKTDGSTFATRTLTTDADAEPVVGVT